MVICVRTNLCFQTNRFDNTTPVSSLGNFYGYRSCDVPIKRTYRIYLKYSLPHLLKFEQIHFTTYLWIQGLKTAGCMANIVDPDQTPHSVRLIYVFTVCSGMPVKILRVNAVPYLDTKLKYHLNFIFYHFIAYI